LNVSAEVTALQNSKKTIDFGVQISGIKTNATQSYVRPPPQQQQQQQKATINPDDVTMFLNNLSHSEREAFLRQYLPAVDQPDRIRRVQIEEADDPEPAPVEPEFDDIIEPASDDLDDAGDKAVAIVQNEEDRDLADENVQLDENVIEEIPDNPRPKRKRLTEIERLLRRTSHPGRSWEHGVRWVENRVMLLNQELGL